MPATSKSNTSSANTNRLVIFNRQSGAVEGWCDDCEDFAGIVSPSAAAGFTAFRLDDVYRSNEPKAYRSSLAMDPFPESWAETFVRPA